MSFWKAIKRKPRASLRIKLCPQCKTPHLQKIMPIGFLNTEHYKCTNCDYEGALYLEVDSENTDEFAEELNDLKRLYPEDVDPESEEKSNKSSPPPPQ